jgi:hypothetical protein
LRLREGMNFFQVIHRISELDQVSGLAELIRGGPTQDPCLLGDDTISQRQ